jgi:hypothetical protein
MTTKQQTLSSVRDELAEIYAPDIGTSIPRTPVWPARDAFKAGFDAAIAELQKRGAAAEFDEAAFLNRFGHWAHRSEVEVGARWGVEQLQPRVSLAEHDAIRMREVAESFKEKVAALEAELDGLYRGMKHAIALIEEQDIEDRTITEEQILVFLSGLSDPDLEAKLREALSGREEGGGEE